MREVTEIVELGNRDKNVKKRAVWCAVEESLLIIDEHFIKCSELQVIGRYRKVLHVSISIDKWDANHPRHP